MGGSNRYRANNPKITEQFADLKRKLGEVTEDEWDAIPDIGDYTIKKKKKESFVPAPDTLMARALAEKETQSSIDANRMRGGGGLETPMGEAITVPHACPCYVGMHEGVLVLWVSAVRLLVQGGKVANRTGRGLRDELTRPFRH